MFRPLVLTLLVSSLFGLGACTSQDTTSTPPASTPDTGGDDIPTESDSSDTPPEEVTEDALEDTSMEDVSTPDVPDVLDVPDLPPDMPEDLMEDETPDEDLPPVCEPSNEVCDDIDNDCDGDIDEGCDDDSDGYCDQTMIDAATDQPLAVCPLGYGDCDDTQNTVHPNYIEACDGLDNDCDGDIDEGCDDDGDGYCDVDLIFEENTDTSTTCAMGPGDCDDTSTFIHPSRDEICDGLDNNCDGAIDQADPGYDQRCSNLPGVCAQTLVTCLDGQPQPCDLATLRADPNRHPEAYEDLPLFGETLCDGLDNNCDGRVDESCADEPCEGFNITSPPEFANSINQTPFVALSLDGQMGLVWTHQDADTPTNMCIGVYHLNLQTRQGTLGLFENECAIQTNLRPYIYEFPNTPDSFFFRYDLSGKPLPNDHYLYSVGVFLPTEGMWMEYLEEEEDIFSPNNISGIIFEQEENLTGPQRYNGNAMDIHDGLTAFVTTMSEGRHTVPYFQAGPDLGSILSLTPDWLNASTLWFDENDNTVMDLRVEDAQTLRLMLQVEDFMGLSVRTYRIAWPSGELLSQTATPSWPASTQQNSHARLVRLQDGSGDLRLSYVAPTDNNEGLAVHHQRLRPGNLPAIAEEGDIALPPADAYFLLPTTDAQPQTRVLMRQGSTVQLLGSETLLSTQSNVPQAIGAGRNWQAINPVVLGDETGQGVFLRLLNREGDLICPPAAP